MPTFSDAQKSKLNELGYSDIVISVLEQSITSDDELSRTFQTILSASEDIFTESEPFVPESIDDVIENAKNNPDLLEQLQCEPESNLVFTEDDTENFNGCQVEGADEVLQGPPDSQLEAELQDFLNDGAAVEAAATGNIEELRKKVSGCLGAIGDVAKEIGDNNTSASKKGITKAKLIEIRDNMYPVYRYHSKLISLLVPDTAYTESQIEEFETGTKFGKYAKVFAKLRDISLTVPTIGILGGGSTIVSSMEDYSTYAEVSHNLPNTSALSLTLNDNLFSVNLNIKNLPEQEPYEDADGNIQTIDNSWTTELEDISIVRGVPSTDFVITGLDADDTDPAGVLYDTFYNQQDDIFQNFFLLEERGLSNNPADVDPGLLAQQQKLKKDYGADADFGDKMVTIQEGDDIVRYIKNQDVYDKFYDTAAQSIPLRLNTIKAEKIEDRDDAEYDKIPTTFKAKSDNIQNSLNQVVNDFEELAVAEAGYYLFDLSSNSSRVSSSIANSNDFIAWWEKLENEIERLSNEIENSAITDPNAMILELQERSPCVKEFKPKKPKDLTQTINMVDSLSATDPTKPNPAKHCYWAKFAEDATKVGLFPFPDINYNGAGFSLRYWPVGLIVPTPGGLYNIPLPQIWKALVTISGAFGTIVVFISICGIIPAPFVFFVTNRGSKYFLFSIWGSSEEFGTKPGVDPIKTFDFRVGAISLPWNFVPDLPTIPTDGTSDFMDKVRNTISDKIDNININMGKVKTNVAKTKDRVYSASDKANDINAKLDEAVGPEVIQERIDSIRDSIIDSIDGIDFPRETYPKDPSKTNYLGAINDSIGVSAELLDKKFKNPIQIVDVRDKVLGYMDQAVQDVIDDIKDELGEDKLSINLKNNADFTKLKDGMVKVNTKILEILNSDELFYSVDAVPVAPITISTNCNDDKVVAPPDVAKEIAILNTANILSGAINTLSNVDVIDITGFVVVKIDDMSSWYKDVLFKIIPPIPLPADKFSEKFKDAMSDNISTIKDIFDQKFELPDILGKVSKQFGIPIPFPESIEIDLNILKELFKGAVMTFFEENDRVFDLLFVDITKTSAYMDIAIPDLKTALKSIVMDQMDEVEKIIAPFLKPYEVIKGLREFEVNLLDTITNTTPAGIAKFIAEFIIAAIKSTTTGIGDNIQVMNQSAVDAAKTIVDTIKIPLIASAALAAFTPDDVKEKIKGLLHPILNFDDLPPWERMDIKSNPLYVFFLDDFCNQGKKYHFQSQALGPTSGITPGFPEKGTG